LGFTLATSTYLGGVIGLKITGQDINRFLDSLPCSLGGKHAYFRALRAFYNWLYSLKSGYNLRPEDNPILMVESPKVKNKILPSLTTQQLDYIIEQARCVRDKSIISLFADSGLRLSELADINPNNIDWERKLIQVTCKGNKEGLAPFGEKTEALLKGWLSEYNADSRLWDINRNGISIMLRRLTRKTGLPCNAHTFRRTFACLLRKHGLDCLTIKDLGRWESLEMVQRYTRSVSFQDSLKFYKAPSS
jgi:site-specific recombinase XerD